MSNRLRLSSLISPLCFETRARVRNFQDVIISNITCDSREVTDGSLFVAISGTSNDGHRFLQDALNLKAVALVVEKDFPVSEIPEDIPVVIVNNARMSFALLCSKFYQFPSHKLNVIGITGTNGKTTTAYLLKSIIETAGHKTGLMGTIKYDVGGTEKSAHLTTPTAKEIQQNLSEALTNGIKYIVMEVTSHALDQYRVYGTRFCGAIFTNLSHEHLDYHKTIDNYRKAKGMLFEMLPPDAYAILNQEDPASEYFRQLTNATVMTYGFTNGSDLKGDILSICPDAMEIILSYNSQNVKVRCSIIGLHNLYNIMAAAACAKAMGVEFTHIVKGIENLRNVPGRLEKIDCGQDFNVFVDYAHTPNALRNVLSTLRELTKGRLIVVFGCGGDRDKQKRPLMGRVAEEIADFVILTSDNPRSEDPQAIIEDIQKGMTDRHRYTVSVDRKEAIRQAIFMARKGDTVLIAGKGHEKVQIFRDKISEFDDCQVAAEVIKQRI